MSRGQMFWALSLLLVAVAAFAAAVFAWPRAALAADRECCYPAHANWPTSYPGANARCFCTGFNNECDETAEPPQQGQHLCYDGRAVATPVIEGQCCTGNDEETCSKNTTQGVEIWWGEFDCGVDPWPGECEAGTTCKCWWWEYPNGWGTQQSPSCTGDPCGANPQNCE